MLMYRSMAIAFLSLPGSFLRGQQTATFVPVHLSVPEDRGALAAARTAADKQKLKNVEIFDKQSFRLTARGASLGVFVTGRATDPGDKRNLVCFVTVIETHIEPHLQLTIGGAIPFTLLRCGLPKAVGLVSGELTGSDVPITMIYSDSIRLPGSHGSESFIDSNDPVVLRWNGPSHQLTIDQNATNKAVDARIETLPGLLHALCGTTRR